MKITVSYATVVEAEIEIDKKFEKIAKRWYRESNGEYFDYLEKWSEDDEFCDYLTDCIKQRDAKYIDHENMCAIWEDGTCIGEW